MPRILHTADWQIGRIYNQFDPDDGALLADARFTVVERIAALANENAVDAVFVAGDVFDAQGVSDRTIHRLFNAMQAFPGHWILIPGNHDAALAESVWTRAARLKAIPQNAHVCLTTQPLLLEEIGIAVLPAPLTQRHTYNDLTEWFASAETPAHLLRIGLAHGSVQGILAEGIDSTNPIAGDRARKARLDYLALGDWHGTKCIDARTWYSGTPETDRFKANASGQVLLVELNKDTQPQVREIPTTQYRWKSLQSRLEVPSDVDELLRTLDSCSANEVVELELSGRCNLASQRRIEESIDQARGRLRALLLDDSQLRMEPGQEDIDALHVDGYVGDVINDLRAVPPGTDAETARDALALLARLLDEDAGARA